MVRRDGRQIRVLSIDAATNQAVCAIHLPSNVLTKFVFYYLSSIKQSLVEQSKGGAQPNINQQIVRETEIPLPPLAEQTRIVAHIEAALASVDAARERLAHVPVLLKKFRQAVLAAACSGRLTSDWREANPGAEAASVLLARRRVERQEKEGKKYKEPAAPDTSELGELPETWEWATVGDLSASIEYGYTESSTRAEVGPKFLRITDIQNEKVEWDEVPYCPISLDREAKYALQTGDIVFARTGATTGKSHLIHSPPRAIFASYLIRVRPLPLVPSRYLALFFQSQNYWAQITEQSVGIGQPNCNGSKLAALVLPVPPLAEQAEIVRRVDALFALAETIENRVKAATARTEKVTQAVLAKAFRGELVETEAEVARREGRDYEPAAVLLQKMKDANDVAKSPPRKKARSVK